MSKLMSIVVMVMVAGLVGGATPPASGPATRVGGAGVELPNEMTLNLGGGVSMKLVLIPAGTFVMGSPADEKDRGEDEGPVREVKISRPFYMGVTAVTQGQWKAVMGAGQAVPWQAAARFARAGDENAATDISWNDASQFCSKLSLKLGKRVRLPTEAQWEYACRAGTQTRYFYGDDPEDSALTDYAWYAKNGYKADAAYGHAVAQKKPNPWGLYDMCGNVNQWCADWVGPYPAGGRPAVDPTGPGGGAMRVFRGGSFMTEAKKCRSASRNRNRPVTRVIDNGLRIVVLP